MRRFDRASLCACSLFLACLLATSHRLEAGFPFVPDPIDQGRQLFSQVWTVNADLDKPGDGLGPMRNDVSCVACHHQGGVGGGGPVDKNVDLLCLVVSPQDRHNLNHLAQKSLSVHPSFGSQGHGSGITTSIVLHKFGADDSYAEWRLQRLGARLNDDLTEVERTRVLRAYQRRHSKQTPVSKLPDFAGVRLALSQRNTPALFGTGLIDKIPAEALSQIAAEQLQREDGISGLVAGRFGWRGQTANLGDFVLNACANELGLNVKGHAQPINPQDLNYQPAGFDMTEDGCEDMIEFVATLPAPIQRKPIRLADAQLVDYGEKLFDQIGCASCHVRRLGDVEGIYSDLLLHDMGLQLTDPSPAPTSRVQTGVQSVAYGGSIQLFAEVDTNADREWKTPPLWGVADSAPYLHDGRAKTLAEAVRLHGGEAQQSVRDFASLSRQDQSFVITFLQTLRAPGF
jgi:CxxC motif-containing protein (DUF1111 family)